MGSRNTYFRGGVVSGGSDLVPMIAISFDDGFDSMKEVADLFESKGMRCGFAVHKAAVVEYGSRVGYAELERLQRRGFEVLNHSVTHPVFKDIDFERARHEVGEFAKDLQKNGIVCRGFVTPNSVAVGSQIDAIKQYHEYAYTVYSGDSRAGWKHDEGVKDGPFDLGRAKIWDGFDGKSLLKEIASEKALASFYEHNVSGSDFSVLSGFLEECDRLGIAVVTPGKMVDALRSRRGVEGYSYPVFREKKLLSQAKKLVNYEGSESASYDELSDVFEVSDTVGGTSSFTVYAKDKLGSFKIDANEDYTVYGAVESLVGSGSLSFGMLVYDESDVFVEKLVVGSTPTDGVLRQYCYTAEKMSYPSGYNLRPYFNIHEASAGSVHKVSLGFDDSGEKIVQFGLEKLECFHEPLTLPSNTFGQLHFKDLERDLFKIENGLIIAKENINLSVSLSVSASELAGGGFARGVIKVLIDGLVDVQRDILVGADKPVFKLDGDIYMRSGDSMSIELWHLLGADLSLNDVYYSSAYLTAEKM